MNFTRFLGVLANRAGGWEAFTDPVELTPAQFARILSDPEINAGAAADAPREGRLRIIRNGVRQGQSLDRVQRLLTAARQPRLYTRNGKEAAVVYLLSLNKDLDNALIMPQKELEELRQKWVRELQEMADLAVQEHLDTSSADDQAARQQKEAQFRLGLAIQQGRCTYQALTDYMTEAFRQDGSTYVVTAGVTGNMTKAVQAVRQKLPALHGEQAVRDCLFQYWKIFLDKSAATFVQNRLTATNYLVRALVRALDPFYTALAQVTVQLSPARYPKQEGMFRLRDILYEKELCIGADGCEEWFEYPAVLVALFSQGRTIEAEKELRKELMEKKRWQLLSDALLPFFYFYGQDAPQTTNPEQRLTLAKEHWAQRPLYLSGVTRLLLGMLDPGEDGQNSSREKDSPSHQKAMSDLFAHSGSYLVRVLCGEADLDRNMFLLFLLLAEDLCARQLPQREQLALRLNGAGEEYTDILNRCGLSPLEDFLSFDASLKAALAADLPATQRKTLFLKALQVCEQTVRDPQAGREALGQDASEYSGHLAAIDAVFARLKAGSHAPLAGLHD